MVAVWFGFTGFARGGARRAFPAPFTLGVFCCSSLSQFLLLRFSCSTTGGYALARGLLSSSVVVFTLVGSFVITYAFRSRLRLWLVVVLLAPGTAAGVGSPLYCVNFLLLGACLLRVGVHGTILRF